jgi:hypothetical protein
MTARGRVFTFDENPKVHYCAPLLSETNADGKFVFYKLHFVITVIFIRPGVPNFPSPRSLLFWDVKRRELVVTDVSGSNSYHRSSVRNQVRLAIDT